MTLEIFNMVKLKIVVFWVMTMHSWVNGYQQFKGT
jgi:hypothetical protein